MLVKMHIFMEKKVIALCDSEILGSVFEEGDFVLDLKSEFYNGEEIDDRKLISFLKDVDIINAVGKKSIGFLRKEKIIDNKDIVKKVAGVPHIEVLIEKD